MFDEAIDDCLSALKYFPHWFLPSKLNRNPHEDLFSIDDILFFDEDFDIVTFFANEMGILRVYLDKINLDDDKYYEDDPETFISVILLAWCNKFKNAKQLRRT